MSLAPGLNVEEKLVVDKSTTADRMGNPGFNVFSTPALVQLFETTAIRLIASHLEQHQGSVGTRVDVAHLGATPVGMIVRCHAELVEVDGKRLTFKLNAYDEKDLIGTGTHERFIVDVSKFLSRVEAKAR